MSSLNTDFVFSDASSSSNSCEDSSPEDENETMQTSIEIPVGNTFPFEFVSFTDEQDQEEIDQEYQE